MEEPTDFDLPPPEKPQFNWKLCISVACTFIFLFLGVIFLAGGIGMPYYIDSKLKQGIRDEIIVDSPNAVAYDRWVNNTQHDSAPTYMKFWIWNITNPDQVLQGAKPKLDEIGPFAYREYTVKLNASFSDGGNKVTYKKWEYFHFDASVSCDRCQTPTSTLVTVASIPFQSVIAGLLYGGDAKDQWWKTLAFDLIADYTNATFFEILTPEELFFGKEYEILKVVAQLKPGTPTRFGLEVNQTIEEALSKDSSTQLTGVKNIIDIWNYTDYEGLGKNLNCWESPIANRIWGNDGLQWWPGIHKNSHPAAFVGDVFRMVWLVGNDTFTFKDIELIHFSIPYWGGLNASEVPWNANFDQFGKFGVQNLTHCEHGAPVYVSKPHFLDADLWYLSRLEGISPPSVWDHDTIIGVERHTGTTMYGRKRLQVNVQVQDGLLIAPGVIQDLYIPVLWVEEGGDIPDNLADDFKGKVYFAIKLQKIIFWVGVVVGSIAAIVSIVAAIYLYFELKKKKSNWIKLPEVM